MSFAGLPCLRVPSRDGRDLVGVSDWDAVELAGCNPDLLGLVGASALSGANRND
jgi:hypothetical protein